MRGCMELDDGSCRRVAARMASGPPSTGTRRARNWPRVIPLIFPSFIVHDTASGWSRVAGSTSLFAQWAGQAHVARQLALTALPHAFHLAAGRSCYHHASLAVATDKTPH